MRVETVLWISPATPAAAVPIPSAAGWLIEPEPETYALERLRVRPPCVVVVDLPSGDSDLPGLIERIQRIAAPVPLLIHDPAVTIAQAVRLARLGVHGFLTDRAEAPGVIEQAIEEARVRTLARLDESLRREAWSNLLVGQSPAMLRVIHIISLVAARRATILITGESGTGKELAAHALHLASPRRLAPWVAVNCGALPENLIEAELFGHVRGAFTGAVQARTGRFEQAEGGTLFLDEIGDLPLEVQAKLLRVLQEREFQRLGSSETLRADVRLVAATNCDLSQRVADGRFREDLYYRLNVVPLQMPPLRQRRDDIPMLAHHFVRKICQQEEIPIKTLTAEAAERLRAPPWPGNVRQLENAVEMAVAMSGERRHLAPSDFPLPAAPSLRAPSDAPAGTPVVALPDEGLDYEQTLAAIERSILEQALRKTGGNKKAAAEMLGLKRTTLSAKVRTLDGIHVHAE